MGKSLSAQAANRAQQLQLHVNGAKAEIEDLRQRSSMLNEALQRADETVGAVSERCDAAAARVNQMDAKVTSLADRTMKSNVEVRAEVRAHPKKRRLRRTHDARASVSVSTVAKGPPTHRWQCAPGAACS